MRGVSPGEGEVGDTSPFRSLRLPFRQASVSSLAPVLAPRYRTPVAPICANAPGSLRGTPRPLPICAGPRARGETRALAPLSMAIMRGSTGARGDGSKASLPVTLAT